MYSVLISIVDSIMQLNTNVLAKLCLCLQAIGAVSAAANEQQLYVTRTAISLDNCH
jgi:hypothetical protein